MSKPKTSSLSWSKLRGTISPWILNAVDCLGYENMTPVQASVVPLFAGNKDVVVEAVTGSGKTLAYVIPILEKLTRLYTAKLEEEKVNGADLSTLNLNNAVLPKGHMFSIIVAPTRELAIQIDNVIKQLISYHQDDTEEEPSDTDEESSSESEDEDSSVSEKPVVKEPKFVIKTQVLVGSLTQAHEDLKRFLRNRPQILVATPGRLLELLSKISLVKTNACEMIVFDEADKLLDFSLQVDIGKILKLLPKQRRIGLFSATIQSAGDSIFKTGMTNPVKIVVKVNNKGNGGSQGSAIPTTLGISYTILKPELKILALMKLLKEEEYRKCIVYLPTGVSVAFIYSLLNMHIRDNYKKHETPYKVHSLHGKLPTKTRVKTLASFSSDAEKSVLLTTDVASRGLDVEDVDLVIQLDPPTNPEVFLHRSGRTARANKKGNAIVFLTEGREEDYVDFMSVKQVQMKELSIELTDAEQAEYNKRLRAWMLLDRAHHDQAIRCYVSFIRYYSKHTATSIFRLASLDYFGYARLYGIIKLPQVPELKRYVKPEDMPDSGFLGEPIDMDNYKYADSQAEKDRIVKQEQYKEKMGKRANRTENDVNSWSAKQSRHDLRIARKEKRANKRAAIEKANAKDTDSEEEKVEEDWKDLVKRKKRSRKEEITGFDDL